jgi:hypothetical protein
VLPALDNSIGCTISRVAGAGLHYWMRRFNCLLIANSAGANSNLLTPIACAAYSAVEARRKGRVYSLWSSRYIYININTAIKSK